MPRVLSFSCFQDFLTYSRYHDWEFVKFTFHSEFYGLKCPVSAMRRSMNELGVFLRPLPPLMDACLVPAWILTFFGGQLVPIYTARWREYQAISPSTCNHKNTKMSSPSAPLMTLMGCLSRPSWILTFFVSRFRFILLDEGNIRPSHLPLVTIKTLKCVRPSWLTVVNWKLHSITISLDEARFRSMQGWRNAWWEQSPPTNVARILTPAWDHIWVRFVVGSHFFTSVIPQVELVTKRQVNIV